MDREEEFKARRRWRIWEIVMTVVNFVTFRPWRDITMRRKMVHIQDDLPPLVGLGNLAKEGLPKRARSKTGDAAAVKLMMRLMRFVADRDGEVSPEETEFVQAFLDRILPVEMEEAAREAMMGEFSDAKVTNSASLMRLEIKSLSKKLSARIKELGGRTKTDDDMLLGFVLDTYRLANVQGLQLLERQAVNMIVDEINISATEMRRIVMQANKEAMADKSE